MLVKVDVPTTTKAVSLHDVTALRLVLTNKLELVVVVVVGKIGKIENTGSLVLVTFCVLAAFVVLAEGTETVADGLEVRTVAVAFDEMVVDLRVDAYVVLRVEDRADDRVDDLEEIVREFVKASVKGAGASVNPPVPVTAVALANTTLAELAKVVLAAVMLPVLADGVPKLTAVEAALGAGTRTM